MYGLRNFLLNFAQFFSIFCYFHLCLNNVKRAQIKKFSKKEKEKERKEKEKERKEKKGAIYERE